MRQTVHIAVALALFASVLHSQSMREQGLASGSGIVRLPSIATVPASHFRIQLGMLAGDDSETVGTVDLAGGLSPEMELYLKLTMDGPAPEAPTTQLGGGLKFILPFHVPFDNEIAFWGEHVASSTPDANVISPRDITRLALVTGNGSGMPTLLAGTAIRGRSVRFLGGAGMMIGVGHAVKLGGEVVYGHTGTSDLRVALSGVVRLHSRVSLQVSPGYARSAEGFGWGISLGIAFSSAMIDFDAGRPATNGDLVPSFEDIERQIREGEKNE